MGLRAELLSGAALQAREPRLSSKALAAADLPDEHQVDPRKLMRALAVAASKAGAQFKSGTVRSLLEKDGKITGVDLDGEHLHAELVVLAAGAWSGLVAGADVDPARVKPVRGQMLELQLRAPIFTRLLKSAGGYVVPRADGTVLVGSTMEMVGFDKNVTAEGLTKLLNAALQLVPELACASLVSTWAGLRPESRPPPCDGPFPQWHPARADYRSAVGTGRSGREAVSRSAALPLSPRGLSHFIFEMLIVLGVHWLFRFPRKWP